MKIQKKKIGGGGGRVGRREGGGLGWGRVRVDVIEGLKFWENSHKKFLGWGGWVGCE